MASSPYPMTPNTISVMLPGGWLGRRVAAGLAPQGSITLLGAITAHAAPLPMLAKLPTGSRQNTRTGTGAPASGLR